MAGYQGLGRILDPATQAVCKSLFDLTAQLQRRLVTLEGAALTSGSPYAAGDNRITEVGAPSDARDAVNLQFLRQYVAAQLAFAEDVPINLGTQVTGTLPVSSGGTGTPTPMTPGSIIFAGPGGVYSQDNAQLFWDDTNNRLGLGTTAPTEQAHAVRQGNSFYLADSYAGLSAFLGRRANGTIAAPSQVLAGDNIMAIGGAGYTSAAAFSTNAALLLYTAAENFTGAATGANLAFQVGQLGSTSIVDALSVTARQNAIIAGQSTVQPTTGTGGLIFVDGTALSGMASNTAGLYANDVAGTVEMFAIDEAGVSNQISPHNFTLFTPRPAAPFPWSFYSRNDYLNLEIGVDIERLATLVEGLTGQPLIHTRALAPTPPRAWAVDQEETMRRSMQAYERWEVGARLNARPRIPAVKSPPPWLETRLLSLGHLDTVRLAALTAELAVWKQAHNVGDLP